MKYDWLACESFDSASRRPLDRHELVTIRKACDQFNTNFNGGYVDGGRYVFEAKPSNLEDLDYDFYESGGHHWRGDHGYGFTCVWGTVLVESFGFEWAAMKNASSLKDCLLAHREAGYHFFPWQYLWGVVESTGHQYSKAQSAWLKIVESVDSSISVPDGWHPAIDALPKSRHTCFKSCGGFKTPPVALFVI